MSKSAKTPNVQEVNERFRLLVESVGHIALFMLDPEGKVATWNKGAELLTQYRAEEITGESVSKLYPAEERVARLQNALESASREARFEDEGWHVRKDGSRFCGFVVLTAIKDSRGQHVGFSCVIRDLTAQRRAENNLRAGEEQFRFLVDRVEEYAIYLLDPEGRIMSWNSGAEKIKQYRADEIIGKNFACFYTAEDVAAGKPQHNLEIATEKGHVHDQGTRVRKDGTTFPADVVITALNDETGKLRGFSKVTRDVSDQMRAREIEAEKMAAVRANEAKDEFLAKLSHELRTPLTPALAAAEFMAENMSEFSEKFSAEINVIRRNVRLEARLIDDLLDLTRVSTGKIQLHQRRVDGHEVAQDALAIARSDIHRKKLVINTDFSAEDHFVWADPVRLEQVYWNLINNAVKFTPASGEIRIQTWNKDGEFAFAITDTGIGIDLDQQKSLFTAFDQGERGISRRFGGLGLGLTICKNLVELHGGTVRVSSRGRSLGTTATVCLKSYLGPEVSAQEEVKLPAGPSRLRILLVEDHEDTRHVLSRLLVKVGCETSLAGTVGDAVKLLRSQPFDAVLSDIGLPDGSGYDVIAEAKRLQDLKGVALTGYGMSEDVRRSKEAGFDWHLTKPVDASELRTVLHKLSEG